MPGRLQFVDNIQKYKVFSGLQKDNMDNNFFSPINVLKVLLKFIGLQRDGQQSKRCSIVTFLIYVLSFMGMIIVQMNHLTSVENDWQEKVINIIIITTVIGAVFKVFWYLNRVESMDLMEENLTNLFEISADFKVQKITEDSYKLITKIMKIYGSIFATNTVVSVIITFGFGNLTLNSKYPFETEAWSLGFFVAGLHQNVAQSITACIYYFSNMYPAVMVIYVTGTIDGIALRLKHIGLNEHFGKEELVECIKIHQMIRLIVNEIQECFKIAFLLQGAMISLILGLCVFTISYISEYFLMIQTMVYCLPMILEILLPCYLCNELTLSSENLINEIFHSDWMKTDRETKKILLILVENTKKPLMITFHGVMDVNLITFRSIMKSAYSLFAVLRRLNN